MEKLKERIYAMLMTDNRLQAKIMLSKDISHATVWRWAKEQKSGLNEMSVLKIIRNHINKKQETDMSIDDLFEAENNL